MCAAHGKPTYISVAGHGIRQRTHGHTALRFIDDDLVFIVDRHIDLSLQPSSGALRLIDLINVVADHHRHDSRGKDGDEPAIPTCPLALHQHNKN